MQSILWRNKVAIDTLIYGKLKRMQLAQAKNYEI